MSVQVKQLKDKGTGTPFVPITHWDAVSGKPDMSTKADKVTGATTGNFAGLDANGNLTDSGSKATDFATTSALTSGLSTKQDVLTAGTNISIDSANTISVTGITVPVVTDFDIKDLADSTGLRAEWSGKQDALTAGANIEIDSAGTISVTGMTSATEETLEDMSFVISSNINKLNDRVTNLENNKQNSSDNSLNTNTKTIIGAINELLTRIEALEARNQAE